ncbi:MAG: hypothetical protein GX413_07735 [Acetobacter sp.]|nr:hypothetical protein [Acetobacter sp.]
MDRIIVYPGQVVTDTDALLSQRYADRSISSALQCAFGVGAVFASGFQFSCDEKTMNISIGEGVLCDQGNADATAYGSLETLSSVTTVQYFWTGGVLSAEQSDSAQTLFVYASLDTTDTDMTLLRYADASSSSGTLSGQNGSGELQATRRASMATLQMASEIPAGDSVVAIYKIVIPPGATALSDSMVSVASEDLFPVTIPKLAPRESPVFTGTPTAPTPDAGDQSARIATTAFVGAYAAGNLLSVSSHIGPDATSGGSTVFQYAPSSRTRLVIMEIMAGGGGGGGCPTCSSSVAAVSGGGGAGGFSKIIIDAKKFSFPVSISLGCGGRGGQSSGGATAGSNGGPSSVGSIITLSGGFGGIVAQGSGVGLIGGSGGGGSVQANAATGMNVIELSYGSCGKSGHVVGVASGAFYGYGGEGGFSAKHAGGWERGSGQTGQTGSAGAGGSGSCVAPSGTWVSGGDGGPGQIVIYEYG